MICLGINFRSTTLGDSYLQSRTTDLRGQEDEKLIASSVIALASFVFGLSSPVIFLTQEAGPTHLPGKQNSEKLGV